MTGARNLFIVEDDAALAGALVRAFERRGYSPHHADSAERAIGMLNQVTPDFAVVDLKLGGASGLECIKALATANAAMRIVVLTGFASISTAVGAIKLGACHYLAKPASADDIEAAFAEDEVDTGIAVTRRQTSVKTLEWEKIHEVLAETGFNVSEAARRLGMHRRTLTRKLAKQRVK
ncbi:response regulator transcription factor [Novosphingobium colocasiae]|uniref:DNA-binding response regulator n=1 Tax=Novosphingobium colocasiae TaxID=1256513 RepID=A0A918PGX0_9SPHN|nr:response regulator transcription factor [Novosphingobium colocasiae]GGZ07094.1 DNA-binding response regulator [Novosphingobium colocasiae]